MCGSGTFLAEAIMIKANIPPSFNRILDNREHGDDLSWDFLNHNYYTKDADLVESTKEMVEVAFQASDKGLAS